MQQLRYSEYSAQLQCVIQTPTPSTTRLFYTCVCVFFTASHLLNLVYPSLTDARSLHAITINNIPKSAPCQRVRVECTNSSSNTLDDGLKELRWRPYINAVCVIRITDDENRAPPETARLSCVVVCIIISVRCHSSRFGSNANLSACDANLRENNTVAHCPKHHSIGWSLGDIHHRRHRNSIAKRCHKLIICYCVCAGLPYYSSVAKLVLTIHYSLARPPPDRRKFFCLLNQRVSATTPSSFP